MLLSSLVDDIARATVGFFDRNRIAFSWHAVSNRAAALLLVGGGVRRGVVLAGEVEPPEVASAPPQDRH